MAAVVVDYTSSECRAGLAGGDGPTSVFPCLVARSPGDPETVFVGKEALSKRQAQPVLKAKRPVECGVVTNWELMEKIWHHIFDKELGVSAEDYPLLISEGGSPKANREKMTSIMFETFKVPYLYLAHRAPLSLLAVGHASGLYLHCGDSMSYCVPVYEGHTVPHALKFSFVGGRDVTDNMMRRLNERGFNYTTVADREMIREMKEKLCYVALDYEQEMNKATAASSSLEKSYELPDGQLVTVCSERFMCPEALFQPNLLGDDYEDSLDIHHVVYKSLVKYSGKEMPQSANVLVSGGSTMFPGFSDRLHKELVALVPPTTKINLMCSPQGSNSGWIGGSMVASLPTFSQMSISREEYEEDGPAIVHRKCF